MVRLGKRVFYRRYIRRFLSAGCMGGAVCYFLLSQYAIASVPVIVGEAFDIESRELVYTETHRWPANGEHQVIYREPSGETFAEKTIVYGEQPTAPSVWQHNQRIGETFVTSTVQDGRLEASYTRTNDNVSKSRSFAVSPSLVIDAGFHPFILEHWKALLAGHEQQINYLLPIRMQEIALNVALVDCVEIQADRVCFTITASNWLLALVAKPLHLVYDTETQRLVEFRGKSNIAAKSGDYHSVKITYTYTDALNE